MNTAEIRALNDQYVINTYGARKLALTRGEGAVVWDADGREYLDFFAGIAVCNLGHAHPKVTAAICAQAGKLLHVSNLYYIEPQVRLAERLSQSSFAHRWFFCNGGAEANEAAIKLTRRYWVQQGTPKPFIITAEQSFHGRTLATIAATGQPKYQKGFEPLPHGFISVPFADVRAIEVAITPSVGAVLLEPIQGEGGVRVAGGAYWKEVRKLCDAHGILLILDEVQTGLGRTGELFCHQSLGITPDVMTLAKGLANGVPIGAMGCTEPVSAGFAPGTHACTFGGNPLSAAAALATLEELSRPEFLKHARAMGNLLLDGLQQLARKHDKIVEVRGQGLMLGVEFEPAVAPLLDKLREAGIICGPAGPNVLRMLPPLIVTQEQIERFLAVLSACLGELEW